MGRWGRKTAAWWRGRPGRILVSLRWGCADPILPKGGRYVARPVVVKGSRSPLLFEVLIRPRRWRVVHADNLFLFGTTIRPTHADVPPPRPPRFPVDKPRIGAHDHLRRGAPPEWPTTET